MKKKKPTLRDFKLNAKEAYQYIKKTGFPIASKYSFDSKICYGKGPARCKVGNKTFFRKEDLDIWMDKQVNFIN